MVFVGQPWLAKIPRLWLPCPQDPGFDITPENACVVTRQGCGRKPHPGSCSAESGWTVNFRGLSSGCPKSKGHWLTIPNMKVRHCGTLRPCGTVRHREGGWYREGGWHNEVGGTVTGWHRWKHQFWSQGGLVSIPITTLTAWENKSVIYRFLLYKRKILIFTPVLWTWMI